MCRVTLGRPQSIPAHRSAGALCPPHCAGPGPKPLRLTWSGSQIRRSPRSYPPDCAYLVFLAQQGLAPAARNRSLCEQPMHKACRPLAPPADSSRADLGQQCHAVADRLDLYRSPRGISSACAKYPMKFPVGRWVLRHRPGTHLAQHSSAQSRVALPAKEPRSDDG